jgi:hypothetical protein
MHPTSRMQILFLLFISLLMHARVHESNKYNQERPNLTPFSTCVDEGTYSDTAELAFLF